MIFFFLHQRLVKVVAALLHSGDASNATATYIEYVGCAHRPNKLAKLKFDRHLRVRIHTQSYTQNSTLYLYDDILSRWIKCSNYSDAIIWEWYARKEKMRKMSATASTRHEHTHTYAQTCDQSVIIIVLFFSKFVSFACSIAWVMTFHLFRLNCVSLPLSKSECAIKIARTV